MNARNSVAVTRDEWERKRIRSKELERETTFKYKGLARMCMDESRGYAAVEE